MKILLVDDSRAIAMVMCARLESFGHEVRHAANGQAAIDLFQAEAIDLILMDIEMPGMNGFEATTRIRALEGHEPWAWTPIIFVTATDTDSNLVTAIEAGGDDFISKTVSEAVLQAKMKAMSRIAALRSRLSQANRKLQDQANRDGLTGLLNRRAMDLQVDTLWEQAARAGRPFSLLMVDVDNFKRYNDHYGHLAGDECLRAVANCIDHCVQHAHDDRTALGAFAARYGGEEFAVVVPDAAPGVHAGLASSLVEAVHALRIPHEKNGDFGVVTISIGGACIDPTAGHVKELFRQADDLLYKAKESGRNRAEVC
ncbi:diguanylate cyclase [Dechloromonas sp. XY25]|uniref:diguanylate cyclase n=1 Tax=Dechloromonas hankyongensis TaxID=2908002 RepID=A0ABS9K197_9RHOO|nr:diguanylate cyclase [Dechloromonas hankyongensis]MCG2576943.1 diguanylate cyclase [Dechloromonas hankyongensis]